MSTVQPAGPLGELVLARETADRATERRSDRDWLDRSWADPGTRVLVVHRGRALVQMADGQAQLVFAVTAEAPEGVRFLLGTEATDAGEAVYYGVSAPIDGTPGAHGTGPGRDAPAPDHAPQLLSLREAGPLLGDRDAGLMTHAVALANWHDSHTHCPADGTPTVVNPGGHSTSCPADGTEHFPRTDPAVIMLVSDPQDRCLLARNKSWPEHRVSVLAGFVDPGESAEHAVAREVHEETGISVGQVTYLGSQPWPLPRSLMLGYRAQAVGDLTIRVDADEISEASWYSRDELLRALDAGKLALPPAVSIARRIIESWFGAELPDGDSAWLR